MLYEECHCPGTGEKWQKKGNYDEVKTMQQEVENYAATSQ